MKLYIKNKIVSLGGASAVYNEQKEQVYNVKGKIITLTKKKFIKNMSNELLYMVRNKYWHFLHRSAYIYNSKHKKIAKIIKKIGINNTYIITGMDDEYKIEGNVLGYNYKILKNGDVIGTIKKEITWVADAFELDCENPEDAPFLVAFVIAIDNISDRK